MLAAPDAPSIPSSNSALKPGFPPLCRLRFRFEALEPLQLPAYSGSTWHGVLGHALRAAVCLTGQPTCAGCLLAQGCAYSAMFESPPADPGLAARYRALPHPYVLEPDAPAEPRELPRGGGFNLGVTLIGTATGFLPHLMLALRRAGTRGFGRGHARFSLVEVEQERTLGADDWTGIFDGGQLTPIDTVTPALPPTPDCLRLRLETPLRLKARGRYVTADALSGADILRSLGERAALLLRLYAPPADPAGAEWTDARAALTSVTVTARDLQWYDCPRFSNRQQAEMRLGGLLGACSLAGTALPEVWPLLWFGQWVHAGKNSAFGLGRYRVLDTGGAVPVR